METVEWGWEAIYSQLETTVSTESTRNNRFDWPRVSRKTLVFTDLGFLERPWRLSKHPKFSWKTHSPRNTLKFLESPSKDLGISRKTLERPRYFLKDPFDLSLTGHGLSLTSHSLSLTIHIDIFHLLTFKFQDFSISALKFQSFQNRPFMKFCPIMKFCKG